MSKISVLNRYLSDDVIDKILNVAEQNPYVPGLILDSNEVNKNNFSEKRICELANLDIPANAWLGNLLMHIANSANVSYGFDLIFPREASVTRYKENGHYVWHHDIDWRWHPCQRKLSISIQLSDSNDYEGGNLEFKDVSIENEEMMRQKGTVIVFPSYLVHRVTPVTKGERKALVSWIEGPSWR
jgi:PKHD-type hydroxylase